MASKLTAQPTGSAHKSVWSALKLWIIRNPEASFVLAFSVAVFSFFYFYLGSNGLILGNDPAVHLQHAEMFLQSGHINLGDVAWFPPLYHVILSTFMAFTGSMNIEQILIVMKALTALFDTLMVLTVYLMAAKFFNKKIGVFAAVALMLCFPLYELNSWGGYTSILSLTFMVLMFMYLALSKNDWGTSALIFVFAFSTVLSHQLVTFLTVILILPFIVVLLATSKGSRSRATLVAVLGGGVAFFLYYVQAILPHLDVLIEHVFFQIKTNLYQLPLVSLTAFEINFGFILVFSCLGLVLSFFRLRRDKKLFFLLCIGFFVPLFLSQTYFFGLYLPYQMFIYYLTPFVAVLAAVSMGFVFDTVLSSYRNNRNGWKRASLKIVSIGIVVALAVFMVIRLDTVASRAQESASFYSLSDAQSYNAGKWLSNTYNGSYAVVAEESPGSWFSAFSGKYTIAKTDPAVDRNLEAECVLDLAYELETPANLVRAYESKGNMSTEYYVLINGVWYPVSAVFESSSYVAYRDENDAMHTVYLFQMSKQLSLSNATDSMTLEVQYSNSELSLAEKVTARNDSYPLTVTWALSAANSSLTSVTLHVHSGFTIKGFLNAYVNGVLNWETPWNNPSKIEDNWMITNYQAQNLTADPYVGIEDKTNETAFFLKFLDLPSFGNIGALNNSDIDAVRYDYEFARVEANQTVTASYQVLTYSTNSFPAIYETLDFRSLFDYKTSFEPMSRSYVDYLRQSDPHIEFIVMDTKSFDPTLLGSGKLEIVYSNSGFIILKLKT